MIEEKTGAVIDLLNAYIEDLQVMRKHHFYNVWQTYQFMLNKANLQPNQIILVQDFARNFVLDFQDEPKDLHWDHDQVTVHPMVLYRCCPNERCDELVMEEIIHITPGLKHDPLAVKHFEEDVEFHLKSNNVKYEEKFIWTDQAPTQYKSCRVFEGIANSATCITHHYYPVRHGKNPADGSSGRLKRKFIRFKKSRGKAIRVAQELFAFTAEKLDTKQQEQGKCLHYRTRIRYFETITRGPMNESKTIPKTHELHSIRSVGITNVVQTRKTTCCCLNCVTGIGQCEFFEIAGKWMFQSVIGETLSKSTINKAHRKINNKGAVSEDQICVNKYRMEKLGKPEKTREKKNSEISPAMYRQKKMEERKRKLPSEDGSKMSQSCRKKIKYGDELVNSTKKKKKGKAA